MTDDSNRIVYIVDDDEGMRDSLHWLVRSAGFHSATFGTMAEFQEAYDPDRLGCVILDLQLPQTTGLEVQEWLSKQGGLLPIIFITGYGDVTSAVTAMRCGAVDFLEKPFDQALLLQRVHEALDRAVVRQDLRESSRKIATLTVREKQILDLVSKGFSSKEIAAQLGRSEKTIEGHRRNIMRKLGAQSVADVVRIATIAQVE